MPCPSSSARTINPNQNSRGHVFHHRGRGMTGGRGRGSGSSDAAWAKEHSPRQPGLWHHSVLHKVGTARAAYRYFSLLKNIHPASFHFRRLLGRWLRLVEGAVLWEGWGWPGKVATCGTTSLWLLRFILLVWPDSYFRSGRCLDLNTPFPLLFLWFVFLSFPFRLLFRFPLGNRHCNRCNLSCVSVLCGAVHYDHGLGCKCCCLGDVI